MSKVRSQMLNLINALAVLTTTFNTGNSGPHKHTAATDYESEAELPVKPPPRKRKKPWVKKVDFKMDDVFAPGMRYEKGWDKSKTDSFAKAKGNWAQENTVEAKGIRLATLKAHISNTEQE